MSQKKDNSGVLFRNSRKKFKPRDKANPDAPREPLNDKEDKKPDYTGETTVNGQDYWIAAWIKTSERQGSKYFSLAFTPKTDRQPEDEP